VLFSVIIPTFRRPLGLGEAVRSALDQGVDVEVMVLDDSPEGSARSTIEAIGDPRVRYVRCATPSGGFPAKVRNAAWREATGSFVHFLDDDDRAAPGAYRRVADAFAAHPERGVVFGRVAPFGDDARALARERAGFSSAARRARLLQRIGWRTWVVANQLYCRTVLVNSACFIRREAIAAIGGYREDVTVMEDVDFYLRAIREVGFVYLDDVLVEYRTGAPSIMNSPRSERAETLAAFQRIYAGYRRRYGRVELVAMKILAKGLLRWL
jgi:glycosyltransferase involved in cell wall biosynthesis